MSLFFKQEDVEIALDQRVAFDEVGQGTTLPGEFLLDGADEDARLVVHVWRGGYTGNRGEGPSGKGGWSGW